MFTFALKFTILYFTLNSCSIRKLSVNIVYVYEHNIKFQSFLVCTSPVSLGTRRMVFKSSVSLFYIYIKQCAAAGHSHTGTYIFY